MELETKFIHVKYDSDKFTYKVACSCGRLADIVIPSTNIDELIFKCEECDLITKLNLHVPFTTGENISPGVYVSWVDVTEAGYTFSKVIGLKECPGNRDEEEILLRDRDNDNFTHENYIQTIHSMDKRDVIENDKYINYVIVFTKKTAIMCMDDQITCSDELQLSLFNMIKYFYICSENIEDTEEELTESFLTEDFETLDAEELKEIEEEEEIGEELFPVKTSRDSIISYGDNLINPEFFKLRGKLIKAGFNVKHNVFLSVYSIRNRKSAVFSVASCLGPRSFQTHFSLEKGGVSSYVLREFDSVIESIFIHTELCKNKGIILEKHIMTEPVVTEIKATSQGQFLEISLDQSPGAWDYVRQLVLFMQNLSKNNSRSNVIMLPERTTRGKNIQVRKEPEFLFKELVAS